MSGAISRGGKTLGAEGLSPQDNAGAAEEGSAGVASDASTPRDSEGGITSPRELDKVVAKEASLGSALPAILFWLTMSCATILFNKFLYTGPFAYPLTLTAIHMSFATLATQALRAMGRLPVPTLGWAFYARNVLPIGVLFACSLGFSNLAAMRLSVSFIQMVKALTPMLTLALAVFMRMEKATASLIAIVSIMCVGVAIASYGELEFDALGLFFQIASIASEAARLVATQSLLQAHLPKPSNPLVSISLFAPCSLLFLLPVALVSEGGALDALLSSTSTALTVLANTCTAFTLNVAVVILVSQTSGLTLTLAGIIKDIILIVAAISLFGNPITYTQVGGYTLALYGLNMYHGYRSGGPKGVVLNFAALAQHAATDRNMMVMGGGMFLLLFVAQKG